MAFIVLALGAVMVVAGSYEVYFGNTYIVVERGWSAFISGTVLLTGGLITIVLGLAMRALADLKTVLIKHMTVVAAFPERAPSAVVSRASFPVLAPDSPSLPHSDRAALFDTPMPEPPATPDEKAITGENSHADRASADVSHAIHEHDDGNPDTGPHPAQPIAADLVQSEPLFDELRARPVEEEVRAEHAGELSPAMDDWLDRNFADLARGGSAAADLDAPPVEAPSPHAALPEPVALAEIERPTAKPHQDETVSWRDRIMSKRAKTPVVPEPEPIREAERAEHPEEAEHRAAEHVEENERASEANPSQDAVPAPEPAASPSPAVIGRYEAEGTSYVMYADGSIEAQSDAGIYRFASMAELKAFIEG